MYTDRDYISIYICIYTTDWEGFSADGEMLENTTCSARPWPTVRSGIAGRGRGLVGVGGPGFSPVAKASADACRQHAHTCRRLNEKTHVLQALGPRWGLGAQGRGRGFSPVGKMATGAGRKTHTCYRPSAHGGGYTVGAGSAGWGAGAGGGGEARVFSCRQNRPARRTGTRYNVGGKAPSLARLPPPGPPLPRHTYL